MTFAVMNVCGIALEDGIVRELRSKMVGKTRLQHQYMAGGKLTTDLFDITLFCYRPELQEMILKIKAGDMVAVSGEFQTRRYSKEGMDYQSMGIVAHSIAVLEPKTADYDPFSEEYGG